MQWMKNMQLASKPWVNKPLQVNTDLQLCRHAAVRSSPPQLPPDPSLPQEECVCALCKNDVCVFGCYTTSHQHVPCQCECVSVCVCVRLIVHHWTTKGEATPVNKIQKKCTIMHIHYTGNRHVFAYFCVYISV